MSASATIHINQTNRGNRVTNRAIKISNESTLNIVDDDDDVNSIDEDINRASPLFFCPRNIGNALYSSRSNSPNMFLNSNKNPPAADDLDQPYSKESNLTLNSKTNSLKQINSFSFSRFNLWIVELLSLGLVLK